MPRCPTCHRRLVVGKPCPDDGAASSPSIVDTSDAAETPPSVAGYTLSRRLGAGGFAVVWQATRDADGMPVALKIARDDTLLDARRLAREADAMRAIGPPHVPRVYATGHALSGLVYIAMELLSGRSLSTVLEHLDGPPDTSFIFQVCECLLNALQAVHDAGVTHRDLKPENAFVTSETAPLSMKLFDFGLTLTPGLPGNERLTRPGTILGSAEYMAPEQFHGERELDQRLDIYAFGVMLYELFTLRPPFTGDRATIEHGHQSLRPPRPRQFSPVPESIERVILACLAKDPDKRPTDIASLRQLMNAAWERAAASSASTLHDSKLSLLVHKRQPVILAAIDTDAAPGDVASTVKQYGGFIARQRDSRHGYICAFSSLSVDDPYEAAVTLGREAADRFGARVALHIAPMVIRRRRRGPAIIGREVENPDTWIPAGQWNGLVLTSALAMTRPEGTTAQAPDCPGVFILLHDAGVVHGRTALYGRDSVLQQAHMSLRACLETRTPGLFTLLGDAGLGKSRLARELAALARGATDSMRVVSVRATRLDAHESDDSVRALVEAFERLEVALNITGAGGSHGRVLSDPGRPVADRDVPVAVVVDDAQWLDSDILDRIEYASLDHKDVPLWIAVVAHPNLQTMRPQWGARANRHDCISLTPLSIDAAMELAAELLLPAEYPPADFLRRLADWASGSPQLLSGLVAALKRRGVVRRRVESGGWHVSTAELEHLPAIPAEQWLAARILAEMAPELAACVRVCAVLGATFSTAELSSVQHTMEQHGGAGTPMDADVGLSRLCDYGLFERVGSERDDPASPTGNQFAFVRPALKDSMYKLLAWGDRTRIHEYAAEYWQSRSGDDSLDADALSRFARHASACGRDERAAAAYIRLGDVAREAHRYVEADNHYTAALHASGLPDDIRARALGGRGRIRYHINRVQESLEDLRAARAIVERLGDHTAAITLLLEEAAATDMGVQYELSSQCAEEASGRLQSFPDPVLETRALMALGRTAWRQGRIPDAIRLLGQAAENARDNDPETEVVALLLLGPSLVWAGEHAQAEQVFERVITRCTERNDYLHECAAYGNRMFLWRKQPERAIDDLRRAMKLARQVGNPDPEHTASHNLAELLFWKGEDDEALPLAQRGRVLQQRFFADVPHDSLLVARIHLARGEFGAAREVFDWVARECNLDNFDTVINIHYQVIEHLLRYPTPEERIASSTYWKTADALIDASSELPREEAIEVLWWYARSALQCGFTGRARKLLGQANRLLPDAPIWHDRVSLLMMKCDK